MIISMVQFFVTFTIMYTLVKISIDTVNLTYNSIRERFEIWRVKSKIKKAIQEIKPQYKHILDIS